MEGPEARIRTQDHEFIARRENTILRTFLGRTALNHIIIESYDEDEDDFHHLTIWQESEYYPELAKFLEDNNYYREMDIPNIPEEVEDAYVIGDDFDVPEGWLDE